MSDVDQAHRERAAQLLFLHKHDPRMSLPPELERIANGPTGRIIKAVMAAVGPVLADLEARVSRLEKDWERRRLLETTERRRLETERRR